MNENINTVGEGLAPPAGASVTVERTTAIIGADFKGSIPTRTQSAPPVILSEAKDRIAMTYYSPNELHYHYKASADRPVIFSEIYYPKGWHASVDGKDLPLFIAAAFWKFARDAALCFSL